MLISALLSASSVVAGGAGFTVAWHTDEESDVMCQPLCILSLGVEGWRQEEGDAVITFTLLSSLLHYLTLCCFQFSDTETSQLPVFGLLCR